MASERDAEDTLQLQPSEHGPLVCLNSMKLKELPRLAEAAHCHAATAFAAQFNYIAALDPEVFGPFQQLQYLALGGELHGPGAQACSTLGSRAVRCAPRP